MMIYAHMTLFTWKIIVWSDGELDRALAYGNSNLCMGRASRLIMTLYYHVIVKQIVGISWPMFLRFLLIVCKVLKLLGFAMLVIMGDDRNIVEPFSYNIVKTKSKVWKRLQRGGITPYLEQLHGNDLQTMTSFVKGWNNKVLKLGGTEFDINEDFIENITGLSIEGRKVHRDKKESKVAL